MPEEEEDDDKKAKGKKDDKKASKGKKDGKKGGKDKGGKDAKDKGGKDKGGSKGGSVKASGAEVGGNKDKKEKHPSNKESIKSPPQKWEKEPKLGPSKESIKSPPQKWEKEPKLGPSKESIKSPPEKWEKEHKLGPEKDKPSEKGGEKPAEGAKDDKAKFAAIFKAAEEASKKSSGAIPSASKEKAGKPEGAEKAEKSSIKSAASVEKTLTETSKTETSDKSSVRSDIKSEVSEVALDLKKKPSVKAPKADEQAASMTVVRTLTARGPVYAEHHYDDETDYDDGSRNYIEIQMFGRRHSASHVDPSSQGGQAWNQCHYDAAQQPVSEALAAQRTTVSYAGYGSDAGHVQAGSRWTSNQQFFSGADPGGEQRADYGDLTVSVWQAPPQQQSDFCRDVAGVPHTTQYTSPRELRAAARLEAARNAMDAARNAMIAHKLREMQQGLAVPLPDDAVTTERVIYEVTHGRPSSPESPATPPYHASSGPLVVRSSQFYGAPGVSQAIVRHETRQSSATRLQTASPPLQVRADSSHGAIYSAAPGPSSMHGSSHGFRGPAAAQPVSLRLSKSVGGVEPLQAKAADIIRQQASIIERQSNIINRQSSIIEQQLNLVDATLRGGVASAGGAQHREAYHVTQVVPQEFGVPALPGAQAEGDAYDDDEMIVNVEVVETNRMSRNPWNRR
ncbi:uncharacterized protein [Dermacentor albipictus]|uniref:uncharacterized protein n=1 Tax=Dermacentor albipictus TaxID=60249 RepID=UPI0031FD4CD3